MAKKKEASWKDKFLEMTSDLLFGFVKEQIKTTFREVSDRVKEAAQKAGKTLAQYFFAGVVLLMGLVYLLIAAVLITRDAFKFSLGVSFLIWSVLLLLLGFVYSAFISKR